MRISTTKYVITATTGEHIVQNTIDNHIQAITRGIDGTINNLTLQLYTLQQQHYNTAFITGDATYPMFRHNQSRSEILCTKRTAMQLQERTTNVYYTRAFLRNLVRSIVQSINQSINQRAPHNRRLL
jgi:hypothetical protein